MTSTSEQVENDAVSVRDDSTHVEGFVYMRRRNWHGATSWDRVFLCADINAGTLLVANSKEALHAGHGEKVKLKVDFSKVSKIDLLAEFETSFSGESDYAGYPTELDTSDYNLSKADVVFADCLFGIATLAPWISEHELVQMFSPFKSHFTSRHHVFRAETRIEALAWVHALGLLLTLHTNVYELPVNNPSNKHGTMSPQSPRSAPEQDVVISNGRKLGDVAVCFSGGGNRALVLTVGYMRALKALDLLRSDKIGYISAVSGGAWASSVYTFFKPGVGAEDDDDLLGKPLSNVGSLTLETLAEEPGKLARCALSLFHKIKRGLLIRGTHLRRLWDSIISAIFLAPFGLDDDIPFTMRELEDDIVRRNPCLTGVEFLVPTNELRPFWITTGVAFVPHAKVIVDSDDESENELEGNDVDVGERNVLSFRSESFGDIDELSEPDIEPNSNIEENASFTRRKSTSTGRESTKMTEPETTQSKSYERECIGRSQSDESLASEDDVVIEEKEAVTAVTSHDGYLGRIFRSAEQSPQELVVVQFTPMYSGTPVRYEFDSSAVVDGPMKLGGGMVETFSYGTREPREFDHRVMRKLQRTISSQSTRMRSSLVTNQLTRVMSRTRSQREMSRSHKSLARLKNRRGGARRGLLKIGRSEDQEQSSRNLLSAVKQVAESRQQTNATQTLRLPVPETFFSLRRVVGVTSHIMSRSYYKNTLLRKLIDAPPLWSPQTETGELDVDANEQHVPSHAAHKLHLGDGGYVDYAGLFPILQRGVSRAIIFVNAGVPMCAPNTDISEWNFNEITMFFGVESKLSEEEDARYLRYNQVFRSTALKELIDQFNALHKAGEPMIVKQRLEVLANRWVGCAGGWSIDVIWVYPSQPAAFLAELPAETAHEIELGEAGMFPGNPDFPHYKSVGQWIPAEPSFSCEQVNLLSRYAEWCVYRCKDMFVDMVEGQLDEE